MTVLLVVVGKSFEILVEAAAAAAVAVAVAVAEG